MGKEDNHFVEKKCAICGKSIVRVNWQVYAYKKKFPGDSCYRYYCSYNCYRKAGGDSGAGECHYVRSKLKNRKRNSSETMQKMS